MRDLTQDLPTFEQVAKELHHIAEDEGTANAAVESYRQSEHCLSRPGISLSPEQYTEIREAVREGRIADAQRQILDVLDNSLQTPYDPHSNPLHNPHYLIPLPPTAGLGARLAATSTLTLPQFSLSLRRFLRSAHYTPRTARFRTSARCCLCRGEIIRGDRYVDGGSYGRRACMGCWTALQEEGWVDR